MKRQLWRLWFFGAGLAAAVAWVVAPHRLTWLQGALGAAWGALRALGLGRGSG